MTCEEHPAQEGIDILTPLCLIQFQEKTPCDRSNASFDDVPDEEEQKMKQMNPCSRNFSSLILFSFSLEQLPTKSRLRRQREKVVNCCIFNFVSLSYLLSCTPIHSLIQV